MTLSEVPSIDLLEAKALLEAKPGTPLHSLVHQVLRDSIETHFDDGQQFWTEGMLIEKLGVSRITVRRALDDLTREGILNRYRAKGSFVCKSTLVSQPETQSELSRIGVFVPRADSPLLAGLLEQVGLIGAEKRQRIAIYLIERGQSIEYMLSQMEDNAENEGLLLMGSPYEVTQALFDALSQRNHRVVCVDTPARNAPFVGVNNEEGIYLGLRHLYDLGHRRVAFIANEPIAHPNVADRAHFFKRFCLENDLEGLVLDPGQKSWENTYTATYYVIEEALEAGATAIFTASDSGAWSALKWLRERSILVPQQISVLGFDDETPSQHTYPTLSSIAIPPDVIARRALELLNSPDLKSTFWPQRELVTPHLVIRESTGPVK